MANEYVTSVELKATLSLTGETYADADIAVAVEAASRGIDEVCRRRFWADANANQVRYYTALTDSIVVIDDLVTLTTLASDANGGTTFADTWTLNTDFTLGPDNADADGRPWELIVRHPLARHYLTTSYPRSLKVTGKFGWPTVPAAIKSAATLMATQLLRRMREAPFGIVGFDETAMRIARTDPHIAFLVNPYVKPAQVLG